MDSQTTLMFDEKHSRSRRADRADILAVPGYWQVPAATEQIAYEAVIEHRAPVSFEYIGFPWATLIDGLRGGSPVVGELLPLLSRFPARTPAHGRRATVAQHIYAAKFIALFRACGVTDLFWSHATHQSTEIDGIRIHPFPLFPAQAPEAVPLSDVLRRRRKYLANFIGAYNPKIYLTNVRDVIFSDANSATDLLIIKRDAWHFERKVYEEQVAGRTPHADALRAEQQRRDEYLQAINHSWFTLCPTGSGPNSIRIFESLCLGSIPIVLTRDLRLPGPQELWDDACIIEDDSEQGYRRAIVTARSMTVAGRLAKLRAGHELISIVGPSGYRRLVVETMAPGGDSTGEV